MAVGIYKITSPTNKVYIGQSWDLEDRRGDYKRLECKKQHKLFNSINKHGWDAHKFEVVMNVSENVTQQIFDQIEQAYMDHYRANGFELLNIREAGSRGRHSEETKELMRLSQVGKVMSPEAIAKIKASKTNPSEKIRQNLSKAQKQLWSDPDHKSKMSEAHKAYIFTEEHKETLKRSAKRGAEHPMFGKGLSKESIEKMKATKKAKGYKWSDETREKMKNRPPISQEARKKIGEAHFGANSCKAKAIVQLTMEGEVVQEWDCISDAARALSISNSNIVRCLKGKSKSCIGHIWKYKE